MVQETVPTKAAKRKRIVTSTGGVTTSLSAMSLVQPTTKRSRIAVALTTTDDIVIESSSNDKPNYLKVPDPIFKKMLSTALEGTEERMNVVLDTPDRLQYARTYAQLINDLFYLRLKEDYWTYYCTTMTSFGTDSMHMSKSICEEHNLHRIQFIQQENILQCQQTIIEQLKQIEDQLSEHQRLASGDQSIDLNRLSTVIPAFVRKGQYKLSADFERKKLLLHYDLNDYRLVQAFYNLLPSEDQVCYFLYMSTMVSHCLSQFRLLQRK